jgi:glycosyltransferase involved in cell wall biosynthesis
MKLAIIDQTGDIAGGAQESLELFLRCAPSDIEPTIVFFKEGAFAARIRSLGIATRHVEVDDELQNVKRERLPLKSLSKLPGTITALRATLRTIGPDVVYTNGIKAHMLGAVSSRSLGIPCVTHHRDILTGPARLALLMTVATATRARIATSRNVARCYPLPNTFVVDNPVDIDSYRSLPSKSEARAMFALSPDDPIAAVIGRINRWKGLDRFLQAVATVNESVRLRALIVGSTVFRDTELLPELHALCAKLDIAHLVTFLDWVEDTRAVYAAVDINVNASYREPFGRTIIEAAASGIPSICFDDSGVSETMVCGKTGLVLDSTDEGALARALRSYAIDHEMRRTSGEAARVWSRRFDARQHADRISAILRAATSRR